jgi:hypothetical protein
MSEKERKVSNKGTLENIRALMAQVETILSEKGINQELRFSGALRIPELGLDVTYAAGSCDTCSGGCSSCSGCSACSGCTGCDNTSSVSMTSGIEEIINPINDKLGGLSQLIKAKLG